MPADFCNEWIDFARNRLREDLVMVGECWSANLPILQQYLEACSCRMSLFDSPLLTNFHKASEQRSDYNLAAIFHKTLVEAHPQYAVTIVGNHDTQPGQSLEAPVAAWFKPLAYALILLRQQGYPCVFYADMYGADYTYTSKEGKACHAIIEKMQELEALLLLRREYATGAQQDYFDAPHCIGWTRSGEAGQAHSGLAVVMSNKAAASKTMRVGSRHAHKVFIDFLRNHNGEVQLNEDGEGLFPCNAASVSVWVQKHS